SAWISSRPRKESAFAIICRIAFWLACSALPLLVFALFKNCVSPDGLLFWLVYPITGVAFGTGVGVFARDLGQHSRLWAMLILVWVALGVWLIEFFTLPQVRFYNHVW